MLIAGTGAAGFLDLWMFVLNQVPVAGGIDALNLHTEVKLSELWDGYKKQISAHYDLTTTVYHFGFSEVTGDMRAVAYRSTDSFRSVPLGTGIGYKPECSSISENSDVARDAGTLMNEQREIQAALPLEERLHIGGEVHVYRLSHDGFRVHVAQRFSDFDEMEAVIFPQKK